RDEQGLVPEGASITPKNNIYLTDGSAAVLCEKSGMITLSAHAFGKGKGIYLPSFTLSFENTRLLLNVIRYAGNELKDTKYITDNLYTECAYYPESKILVVINNSDQLQKTTIDTEYGQQTLELDPFDTIIRTIGD
ncbi:1,3-beta-galactosyl-N-acetylhexosamine phosphorylase C-terminal domain-containing protein, partial [Paenibacillus odorifer]